MPGRTVRVSDAAHTALKTLAHADGVSLQEELDRAVEWYRRQRFLAEANAAFARLRADDKAWQEEIEERQAWDVTMADGLDSP
jgi:hypothetical protein